MAAGREVAAVRRAGRKTLGGSRMNAVPNTYPVIESSARLGDYDVFKIREDFPILSQKVHGKPLVYLDNAATTQKPRAVIAALTHYSTTENPNIHRGVQALSKLATKIYKRPRKKIKLFIHPP